MLDLLNAKLTHERQWREPTIQEVEGVEVEGVEVEGVEVEEDGGVDGADIR